MENCFSPYCGLCGKRETLGFFRIMRDRKGSYGIYFTSIPLYGPLVLLLLEEFLLVLYNWIGLRFVIQKFEIVGVIFVYSFV